MCESYSIIQYQLKKSTKPCDVFAALEALIQKHSVFYQECLFRVEVLICEFEHEGKRRSNRNKNAVNTLLRRHPELQSYYSYAKEEKSPIGINENVSLSNFSLDDLGCRGEIEYNLIQDIVKQVPRPYGVNDLDLIYNGVSFGEKNEESAKIRYPENGFGAPVGNYIWYRRTVYGAEKHSAILFAINDENTESMRKFFFELEEIVPGKYEGTERGER